MFSSYWLWIAPALEPPLTALNRFICKESFMSFYHNERDIQFRSGSTARHLFSVLQIVRVSSHRGILKHCPFKNEEVSKAYKAAVIISILYRGGGCDAACQGKRPDQPRTFCRENWLCSNHGMKLGRKCGQRHAVRNYVSVSQGKQASTHSLKSSRLGLKCVLTSWGQMGSISLYELEPFVTV